MQMRYVLLLLFTVTFGLSCERSAAPVSISTKPISINDVRQTNVPLPPSKPFAEMSWTLENGSVETLAEHRGKAVILDFWATYCPPCREEVPHLNGLLAKYPNDLVIIGLNVGGEDDKPEIPLFTAQTKFSYPIAFPENELTRFAFAERDDLPQTIVVGRDGKIVSKIVGFNKPLAAELDAAVAKAVSLQN